MADLKGLTDDQLIERMLAEHEAGTADVWKAYENAATAYAVAVGATWPHETVVARNSTSYVTR